MHVVLWCAGQQIPLHFSKPCGGLLPHTWEQEGQMNTTNCNLVISQSNLLQMVMNMLNSTKNEAPRRGQVRPKRAQMQMREFSNQKCGPHLTHHPDAQSVCIELSSRIVHQICVHLIHPFILLSITSAYRNPTGTRNNL